MTSNAKRTAPEAESTGAEVSIDQTDSAYLAAGSFGDLVSMAGDNLVTAAEVFGDGYALTDQKRLVGVTFIVNGYKEVLGDFGPYASVTAILQTPITVEGELVSKVRFNDGGTGILASLDGSPRDANGNFRPVLCRKGLKESNYVHPEHGPSTTYYFDTSA